MLFTSSDSCFVFWDLGVQSCASWVQAWGSILALAIACIGLLYQSNNQRKLAESEAKRISTDTFLRTAGAIASAGNRLLLRLLEKITDLKSLVCYVLEGEFHLPAIELLAMQKWLEGIPIQEVPEDLQQELLILSANIRQVRHLLNVVNSIHQQMDEKQFTDFRNAISAAREGVGKSAVIFDVRIARVRRNAEA